MNITEARFVTQDDFDDSIARNLEAREKEILDYMVAEAVLTESARSLAGVGDWPKALVKYKDVRPDRVAAQLTGADLATVNQLQHRDRVQLLLTTTGQEKEKAETSLAALEATIPSERLDTAVTRVKAAAVPA